MLLKTFIAGAHMGFEIMSLILELGTSKGDKKIQNTCKIEMIQLYLFRKLVVQGGMDRSRNAESTTQTLVGQFDTLEENSFCY